MSSSDLFARGAAIALLLFIASFSVLSFAYPFWPDVSPFRSSLVLSTLSVSFAAFPLLLVHLTRIAMGGTASDAGRANYLFVFSLLVPALTLLFSVLLLFGLIRV